MTDNTRPRIGITAKSRDKDYFDRWIRNYWWAVLWAGGEPVLLTPETAVLPPGEQLAELDGLLLSGGGDVHPRYYGRPLEGTEKRAIHISRDELELGLARAALHTDVPVLAVCRGLQVLNVAAGGGLVQHVDGHRSPPGSVLRHDVEVRPGTLLAEILGADGRLSTNTYHHQAVTLELLAPGLQPAATTVAGPPILEGITGEDHRWMLGVQWHPERFYELDTAHRRLFTAFVAAARDGVRP